MHASRRVSVVLVDDDPAAVDALQELLVGRGMDVHATTRSADVLDLVAQVRPAVVVLDVHMPAPNGFELCRRILRDADPAPAILFLSGDGGPPQVVEGLEAGAIDYVSKGGDVRTLVAKVEAAARLGGRMQQLASDAVRDPLTGLGNRAALEQAGRSLLSGTSRHGREVACLLLDIDRFKSINDGHGHAAGDAVLVEVARRLRDTCRLEDQLFRVGGEEFVVLAMETSPDAARRLAERLRAAVGATPVALSGASGEADRRIQATVTIGVAGGRGETSLDALLARADAAMYAGKRAGRNRVVRYGSLPRGAARRIEQG